MRIFNCGSPKIRSMIAGPHFFKKFIAIFIKKYNIILAGPTPSSTIYYGFIYKLFHPSSRFIVYPHMHVNDPNHTTFLIFSVLKKADYIFSTTDIEKRYLISKGIHSGKIIRINNGIENILFQKKINKKVTPLNYILYLGQESEHKNIPLLLKAVEKIWRLGTDCNLVIAGSRTQYSAHLDDMINKYPVGQKKRIYRFNNISDEEKISLLDNCLFLVCPSSSESFGLVFVEAWARKKAVIGANIDAVQEVINQCEGGLVFKNKDVNDLVKKILILLKNHKLQKKLAENGYREAITKYKWDNIINNVNNIFNNTDC